MQIHTHSVQYLPIPPDHAGQRLDNFLFTHLKTVPKTHIYRILRTGEVRINKSRVKPSYRLAVGDTMRLPPMKIEAQVAAPKASLSQTEQILACILFENDHFIVLNKPSGWAVHGGSGLNFGVIEALRQAHPAGDRLELVHRLDRDTSGCLAIAKKHSALRALHALWREGRVNKYYQALVMGQVRRAVTVNAPLKKNILKSGERIVRVQEEGSTAITEFKPLSKFKDATLLSANPLTGRTHQIRVHSAHLGHDIAGDPKYGLEKSLAWAKGQGLKRLFLHAANLSFQIPNQLLVDVHAPMDAHLSQFLTKLSTED